MKKIYILLYIILAIFLSSLASAVTILNEGTGVSYDATVSDANGRGHFFNTSEIITITKIEFQASETSTQCEIWTTNGMAFGSTTTTKVANGSISGLNCTLNASGYTTTVGQSYFINSQSGGASRDSRYKTPISPDMPKVNTYTYFGGYSACTSVCDPGEALSSQAGLDIGGAVSQVYFYVGAPITDPEINTTIIEPTENENIGLTDIIADGVGVTINGIYNTSGSECIINNTLFAPITPTGSYNFSFLSTNISNGFYSIKVICNQTGYANGTDTRNFYYNTSLMLIIKEEITRGLLNGTLIDIEAFGDIYSENTTTNTSYAFIYPNLELITIRYDSNDYFERFYFLNVTDLDSNNLTLYLVNSTLATEITATTYDNANILLEEAYIRALRYYPLTNTYELVEMARSNSEGKTKLHLIKNSEFYKFMLYYPFNTLRKTTIPTYVYEDSINFQIPITQNVGDEFFNSYGVTYTLSFNNDTNNFRFDFSDANANTVSGVLKVYQVGAFGNTLLNTTTITGASGTALINIPGNNDTTYLAEALLDVGGGDYFLDSTTVTFTTAKPLGNMGLFAILLLTVVFAFVGFYDIRIALIITPIPLLLGSIMNIIQFSFPIIIAVEVLAVMLAIMLSKNG